MHIAFRKTILTAKLRSLLLWCVFMSVCRLDEGMLSKAPLIINYSRFFAIALPEAKINIFQIKRIQELPTMQLQLFTTPRVYSTSVIKKNNSESWVNCIWQSILKETQAIKRHRRFHVTVIQCKLNVRSSKITEKRKCRENTNATIKKMNQSENV